MTRASLTSMLAAFAVGATACAGDDGGRLSKAEYEETVRSAYAEVQESFRRTNVEAEALADRVEDAQDELRDAASTLEEVEPPEEVEAENAQIAESMRQYADDLDVLREAAERGDTAAIASFNSSIAENMSIHLMAEAGERMRFKGYDVGPIGEE